jgi:hypothetical protein
MPLDPPLSTGRANALFALLLASCAIILAYQVNEAFVGKHEGWNGAVYSLAAGNYLAHGMDTKLGVVLNGDDVPPAAFLYYTNHPPLLPMVVAGSFAIFGPHEWAARLVPILFTLVSLILIWRIGVFVRGQAFGLLAVAIFAFVPMNAFYGRMVDHEALVLAFVLGALFCYLRWRADAAPGWLAGSLGLLALAMATGWPGYYMAGFLPVHHLLTERGTRRDRRVLLYPLLAFAAFAVFLLHVQWLRGGGGLDELVRQFATRTSAHTADFTEGGASRFSWPGFAMLWAARAYKLFTLPVLIVAAFALWDMLCDRGGPHARSHGVALLLAVFAATHLVLFRQGAWVHEYWGFYLSAPLAWLAAGGVLGLMRERTTPRLIVLFMLLFLGAALPRMRALYAADDERVMAFATLAATHTRSGELISTNDGFVKPQVTWYAKRDVIETPLWSAAALEDTLRSRAPRPVAFFLLKGEPESESLDAWLGSHYPADLDSIGPRRYRIFHIPGAVR